MTVVSAFAQEIHDIAQSGRDPNTCLERIKKACLREISSAPPVGETGGQRALEGGEASTPSDGA